MTVHIVITETATGWDVDVDEADNVLIRTEGDAIYVSAKADTPSGPLDVTLAAS